MSTMDKLAFRLVESSTLALKYTNETDGLIIEIAVLPDGVDIRGVIETEGEDMNHTSYKIEWGTITMAETNPMNHAIEQVKQALVKSI